MIVLKAKTLMFQGTSSNVGKSALTAAFCRILLQDGYQVVPFKAQNMALNSYVTKDGGEMGRAQVVQAEAAKLEPFVQMNPILLKPTQHAKSQVIVMGKSVGNLSAKEYHQQFKTKAWEVIKESMDYLTDNFEAMLIEGAGSPAEVNLKENDVVNMKVARELNAPVFLIADIDRGGSIASVVGTLILLDQEERDLVKGIIINKFRGDIDLLTPALDFIEEKTGKPVVGVVPYFEEIAIPEEDSVVIERRSIKGKRDNLLDIAVINLRHLSNFTDFDILHDEEDVNLRYVRKLEDLGTPDMIIIPGSKNTIGDMLFLKETGLDQAIIKAQAAGTWIFGICGGYQLLGKEIRDPNKTESDLLELDALGLINTITTFDTEKITTQVQGKVLADYGILEGCKDLDFNGYEIHMGTTEDHGKSQEPFLITNRFGKEEKLPDGLISSNGRVLGTYIHGIFDADQLRRQILNNIRKDKGWESITTSNINYHAEKEKAFNELADIVRASFDMEKVYKIMGLK